MKRVMTKNLYALSAVAALGGATLAVPTLASAEVTGNIGVFSDYVLRGNTGGLEDDDAALQGGFDYAHESGFYAGYWGSSLSYSSPENDPDKVDPVNGFENDIYAGYATDLGPVSLDAGLIYYYYLNVDDSDAVEVAASVGFGPVSLGAKYLTDDVAWGNEGDTYITLSGGTDIGAGFSVGATLGYYVYTKDGEFIAETADSESSGFKHLDLSLSHPVGDTGADMSITYIIGGEDRVGQELPDAMVLGLSYGFGVM